MIISTGNGLKEIKIAYDTAIKYRRGVTVKSNYPSDISDFNLTNIIL